MFFSALNNCFNVELLQTKNRPSIQPLIVIHMNNKKKTLKLFLEKRD